MLSVRCWLLDVFPSKFSPKDFSVFLPWTAFVQPCLSQCRARKVKYDNNERDRQTTRTRIQRPPAARRRRTRRPHRPRQLVVRPDARHRRKRDGLERRRRTAPGANLDARRKPRSEGLNLERQKKEFRMKKQNLCDSRK